MKYYLIEIEDGERKLVTADELDNDDLKNHMKWLSSLKEEAKDLLFVSIYGNRLKEGDIWREMKNLGAEAGLEKLTNHMLRHYHATKLYKAGMSILEIAEHMGITPRTVERYIHCDSQEADQKAMEIIARNKPKIPEPQVQIPQPQPQQPQTELDKALQLERLRAENLRMELEIAKAITQHENRTGVGYI